jgi:hypothetical protein
MGIFNKLFGSGGKENKAGIETGMRDQNRDREHFEKEYRKRDELILESEELLHAKQKDGTVTPYQYWSVAMDYFDKIRIQYSLGLPVGDLRSVYAKALDYYVQGWDEQEATYADMLSMTALAILLQIPDTDFDRLVAYIDKTENNKNLADWYPDALLGLLIHARRPERKIPERLLVASVYRDLYRAAQMEGEKAADALKEYMESWYELNNGAPWYNSHLKPQGYKGYWAWEVAAVVKVKQIDDSSFRDHPYYPADMVVDKNSSLSA